VLLYDLLRCRKKKKEEQQQAEQGAQVAQIALHFGQEAARRNAERKVAEKVVERGAEKVAVAAGGRALSGLAAVAARANLLLASAELTLFLAGALASYAYGSMYQGTRGHLLGVALGYIGTQTDRLAKAGDTAMALEDEVSARDTGDPMGDADTEALRNRTFDAMVAFRLSLRNAIATLNGYSQQYTAIYKRNGLKDVDLNQKLIVANGLIGNGDRSALALTQMRLDLVEVANLYAASVERLYNERDAIFKEDVSAWLAGVR
jgi:hypothetical protein